jgi:hypothetical protein
MGQQQQQALIAGLTPGAGQGLFSVGAQVLVAAMPTTFFDSIAATVIYTTHKQKQLRELVWAIIKVAGTITPSTSWPST